MFTGIIQTTGRLERRVARGTGARITVASARPLPRLAVGESIAVNGACLTVTSRAGRRFTADVSPETLRRTTLGRVAPGARVNLERALRVGDPIGGHVVQGHVDGMARLEAVRPDRQWLLYRFRGPRALTPYLVEKGSVALDGVSLTVFSCRGPSFTVALIPHTLAQTTLGDLEPGVRVNVEADVLLKYIAKLVRTRGPRRARRRR